MTLLFTLILIMLIWLFFLSFIKFPVAQNPFLLNASLKSKSTFSSWSNGGLWWTRTYSNIQAGCFSQSLNGHIENSWCVHVHDSAWTHAYKCGQSRIRGKTQAWMNWLHPTHQSAATQGGDRRNALGSATWWIPAKVSVHLRGYHPKSYSFSTFLH